MAALGDEEVRLEVVSTDVGPITIADVEMARDIGANILAFGVKPAVAAVETSAKNNGVRICQQRVIYHMLQDVSTSGLGPCMPQCIRTGWPASDALQATQFQHSLHASNVLQHKLCIHRKVDCSCGLPEMRSGENQSCTRVCL